MWRVMVCRIYSTQYKVVENRLPLFVAKQIPLTQLPLTTVGVDDVGIQKSCFQVVQDYRKITYTNDGTNDYDVLITCNVII